MLIMLCSLPMFAKDEAAGQDIFKARCSACHSVHEKIVGPALKDVHKRRGSQWLTGFIRSSQSMVKKGDADAVALFNQFNKLVMPDHTDLTAADVENIIAFVAAESEKVLEETKVTPQQAQITAWPLSFMDYHVWIPFTLVFILMFCVLFAIVSAKSVLAGIQS